MLVKNSFLPVVWAAFLVAVPNVHCAEYEVSPSIAVTQEYTDNLFETPTNRVTESITRIQPGLSILYKAPLWDWQSSYNFDYRIYDRGKKGDETTHALAANGSIRLIEELLFLDVSDTYSRVSLDATRDTSRESLFVNQTDRNVATISPHMILRPTTGVSIRTGYRYINTWYRDSAASPKQDHAAFIDTSYEVTPKLSVSANYEFTREIADQYEFNRQVTSAGPSYEYAEKSFIFVRGGASIIKYDARPSTIGPYWSAGLTHTFDTVIATLSTGVSYTDDPLGNAFQEEYYTVSLKKQLRERASVELTGGYTQFTNTVTDIAQNKRYSGAIKGTYEIIPNLQGNLDLTYVRYHDLLRDGFTDKYFVDSGLSYTFGKGWSTRAAYSYLDYSSQQIATDNKWVNRVTIELKKTF